MTRTIDRRHILLITGVPGCGKTTFVRKLAAALAGERIAGFYTEELRVAGERQGFRLIGFDGEQGIIAHVDFDHRQRVSKYGVDVSAIDHLAARTLVLATDVDVYLVDEIGKMECLSAGFVSRMTALLDSGQTVIATVAKKGSGPIAAVKRRTDAELWELTHANRDGLVAQALAWLAALRKPATVDAGQ